ncbi:MAG: nitroreductase [Acidimicrobiales bacterium]
MDAIAALRNKRDQRDYTDEPIADDLLDTVLDAARMAGSAKNQQPVRLVVVTDPATKEALKAGGDFAAWIDRPPVLVVFTVRADAGPRALFDVGRHAQNLMVAATALGLSSCPVTFHHQAVVREILGIPDDVDAPMVVSLGHPAPSSGPSPVAGPRLPLGDYVHRGRWAD